MTEPSSPPIHHPRWLVPAGWAVNGIMALAALWAVIVVIRNWSRIGV